ncbi:hypothetical protein EJ06DRAFT_519152 [Trichodelitschia bisporula]|uniref:Uncharacterized protein n=1 Tax=Trichodelitschia bisporula TaxID=703511 RepID=A0A6G1I5F7_9PEZI|nr:hypothetical protein EJ06DRAFT_519152 [Trichodelitschia bisporula]
MSGYPREHRRHYDNDADHDLSDSPPRRRAPRRDVPQPQRHPSILVSDTNPPRRHRSKSAIIRTSSDEDSDRPRRKDRSSRHDVERKTGTEHKHFRDRRYAYESDEGEMLKRAMRGGREPDLFDDDDPTPRAGRSARQSGDERALPIRGGPPPIARSRTYREPGRREWDEYGPPPPRDTHDPRSLGVPYDARGYRSDEPPRRERPRRDDHGREDRPRRRDDPYQAERSRRGGGRDPEEYFSDSRHDRDRRRRGADDDRRDRGGKKGGLNWQKEAGALFATYALPVIKKEGGRYLKKEVQRFLSRQSGGAA